MSDGDAGVMQARQAPEQLWLEQLWFAIDAEACYRAINHGAARASSDNCNKTTLNTCVK